MDSYYVMFGWCMLLVATIFALGLVPSLASSFYSDSPGVLRRLAAPSIFGTLAAACFLGMGLGALISIALLGLTQIFASRWRRHSAA